MIWVAIALLVVVAALAITTRRGRAVEPLGAARGAGAASDRGALFRLMKSPDAVERAAFLVRQGNKVEAIAVLREATGLDLTAAKQAVDEIEHQLATGGPLGRLLDPNAGYDRER